MDLINPQSAVFQFNETAVRIHQDENNDPWFVAKDIGDVLELQNIRASVALLDDDEKSVNTIYTPSGEQEMVIINESGLYSLILRSRKPEAKAFKKWVTSEVLPAIRKQGGYIASTPEMSEAEIMAKALQIANATIERGKAQLAEANRQLELQQPAVEYCNDVLAAQNLHTINSVAVQIGVSAIRMNKFLLDEGWIYKQGGIYYPSCKIRNKGFAQFQVVPYINAQGEKMTREHLKWTELGRRAIIELWNRRSTAK